MFEMKRGGREAAPFFVHGVGERSSPLRFMEDFWFVNESRVCRRGELCSPLARQAGWRFHTQPMYIHYNFFLRLNSFAIPKIVTGRFSISSLV